MPMQSSFITSKNKSGFYNLVLKPISIVCMMAYPFAVMSLPQGGTVTGGNANLVQSGSTLNINQTSELVSINYDSFNISSGETVNFNQPGSDSIALNNITGNNATEIFGSLNANGQVFLINPNGILFAPGSQINVGGLFASTLSMSNEDFFNQNFKLDATATNNSIKNYGQLQGGYIAFVSPNIENHGEITAKNINLHAADSVLVSFSQGIHIETTTSTYEASIKNNGLLSASGGEVVLTAATHNDLLGTVINNEGVIEASGLIEKEGKIFLVAEDQGDVINSGSITTSAIEQDVNGGEIELRAQRVAQLGTIHADALGQGDGGQVHLKADKVVALGEKSITTANAGSVGKGGEVIALSPDTTLFRSDAVIEAKGGSESGDGGYVDVSGFQHVEAFGLVDVSATLGEHGTFLIDPTNITIGAAANNNITPATPFEAQVGSGSYLNFVTLMTALETGAAIVVRTDTGFDAGEAGNITIESVLISSDNNGDGTSGSSLSLIADNDIIFNAGSSIQDQFTADAALGISLNAGNDIIFNSGVFIETVGGTFTAIAGNHLTMVDTSSVDVGSGLISVTTTGDATISSLITTSASASAIVINAGGSIIDGGDTSVDLTAINGTANLTAAGTIGSGNALETNVNQLITNITPATVPADIPAAVNNATSIAQEGNQLNEEAEVLTSFDSHKLEQSPAELAFSQVFQACNASGKLSKSQCKAENELKGFLQSLLIGGQLPKTEEDE